MGYDSHDIECRRRVKHHLDGLDFSNDSESGHTLEQAPCIFSIEEAIIGT